MINQNTVNTVNEAIGEGNRFFSFDERTFALLSSSPSNETYRELEIRDGINVYLDSYVVIDELAAKLRFYNALL